MVRQTYVEGNVNRTMDPILEEVYSTVIPSAPYVIGAYVLIWVILMVLFVVMLVAARKTQKDIDALDEAIERLEKKQS